jgi:hypothetical protein
VLYIGPFDEKEGQVLTVIYRDKQKNAFAKLVHIKGFIHDKEYELIKDRVGKIDELIMGKSEHTVHLRFVPQKRARVHETVFDLSTLNPCGLGARGTRMAAKPVARIKLLENRTHKTQEHGP